MSIPIPYDILRLIWWAVLGVLLIGFAVLDGYLMVRYGRRSLAESEGGEPAEPGPAGTPPASDETPVLTY